MSTKILEDHILETRKKLLTTAQEFANIWSKDPTTKVGCLIVDDKRRILSFGYNGFPRGVHDLEERLNDRPTKHKFTCHAERNALDQAMVDVSGCDLYTTLFPCVECAKSIIQKGIKRVVTYKPGRFDDWDWDFSITMLEESGVEIIYVV